MKKTYLLLILPLFVLASCDSKTAKPTTGSNNPESNSALSISQTSPKSDKESHPSTPSDIKSSTFSPATPTFDFNNDTKQSMIEYLGRDDILPFPIGFSQNYIDASGTDQDGECFIVYDKTADITQSYEEQLLNMGYISDEAETDNGITYHYYSLERDDLEKAISVQTDYQNGEFEIFAWLSEKTPQYETFPYTEIANFFEKDSLTETSIPSFVLDEGEKYDGYTAEDIFYVGGYVKEDFQESTYETALETLGYKIDKEQNIATSQNLGFEVDYLLSDGYFLIGIQEYLPVTSGDKITTLKSSDFPASYTDSTITKDSLELSVTKIMSTNNYIQFSKIKNGQKAQLNLLTSLDKLSSIVVTKDSSIDLQYYTPLSLYVSSSLISAENIGTKIEPSESDGVYTYTIPEGNHYFMLSNDSEKYASKNASIVINYSIL